MPVGNRDSNHSAHAGSRRSRPPPPQLLRLPMTPAALPLLSPPRSVCACFAHAVAGILASAVVLPPTALLSSRISQLFPPPARVLASAPQLLQQEHQRQLVELRKAEEKFNLEKVRCCLKE
jgi:hypothetical protein